MLQLHEVRKAYKTGDFTQVALDDVSISFRANEFVAVLGPSGSGKTTLLNIVGGLDTYDSGDLVIEGVSTSKYRDRDWDTYRNDRVGFVFQSYNLIPHQSVLSNVELALTLAGVSRAERRQRATASLEEVGLGDHLHKRPNQLSGGQMQRVAIARALVNDPEILLADEPTGALDSHTSTQIMGLLTRIAADRLVIMVTHNPELAEAYATRTVSLSDGHVVSDTDPFVPRRAAHEQASRARRTSMSFLTAIALSFNNLMTKKGRTIMTSFAGSIGIIGIAAILALANGVNEYIKGVEEETLSMYPLSIQKQGLDMTSLLAASAGVGDEEGPGADADPASGDRVHEYQLITSMFTSVGTNDLASLKRFLDSGGDGIGEYANAIEYTYDVTPQIFNPDTSDKVRQVNPDKTFSSLGWAPDPGSTSFMVDSMGSNLFSQLAEDLTMVEDQYDVVSGHWPQNKDEVVVVLSPSGGLSDFVLYAMGLRDPAELDEMVKQMNEAKDVVVPEDTQSFTYEEIMDTSFNLVHATDYYSYDDEFEVWKDRSGNKKFMKQLVKDGEELEVSGILQPKPDAKAAALQSGIYYTPDLTRHIVKQAEKSKIVQQQLADPDTDVFSGRGFSDDPADLEDDFDIGSLMKIDEDALGDAFTFDEAALQFDPSGLDLDLSGLDFDVSSLDISSSQLPSMDLESLVGGLDLADIIRVPGQGADLEGLAGLLGGLGEDYLQFSQENGFDPEDIATSLPLFLESDEAEDLLEDLEQTLADGVSVAADLVESYISYSMDNGLDPSDAEANFPAFLDSEEGEAAVGDLAEAGSDAEDLLIRAVGDYLTFSLATDSNPLEVEENFPGFLDSDPGQNFLSEAGASIDLGAVQRELEAGLGGYLEQVMGTYMSEVGNQISSALETQLGSAMEASMAQLADNMSDAMGIDEDAFAEAFEFDMDPDELMELLMSMAASEQSSYDGNMRRLGWASFDEPAQIDIYPVDFESKAQITQILEDYNQRMKDDGKEDQVVTWTDIVGSLMSSVTDIINMISYVLIAFVAISLVVSSIMIGIITYISVLERKKEIGILRSIGASKRDIGRVFNAETLIVGLVAGLLGIAITVALTIPANAIVLAQFDVANIAVLPWMAAVVLVLVSMALTFLAGLIPSSAASREDPVEALRSE